LGTTTAQHGCTAFGLHAGSETVGLNALAAIGLECALGHRNALLFAVENLRLDGKYLVYRRSGFESSPTSLHPRDASHASLCNSHSAGSSSRTEDQNLRNEMHKKWLV